MEKLDKIKLRMAWVGIILLVYIFVMGFWGDSRYAEYKAKNSKNIKEGCYSYRGSVGPSKSRAIFKIDSKYVSFGGRIHNSPMSSARYDELRSTVVANRGKCYKVKYVLINSTFFFGILSEPRVYIYDYESFK